MMNSKDDITPAEKMTAVDLDQDGHLCDHTVWTPAIAQQLANTLDVTLNAEHLAILQQVRAFFYQIQSRASDPPAD